MKNILIVNYRMGNLHSVSSALLALGVRHGISSNPHDVVGADALILPGVGAFGEAVENLHAMELFEPVKQAALNGKPLLGICLGMQLLFEDSTEGGFHQGFGLVPGHVVEMDPAWGVKLPHVGWNEIEVHCREPLFGRITQTSHFYFDHSFHATCPVDAVAAQVDYGRDLVAAVQRDRVFGVQFHPEKSQNNGLRVLRGFANVVAQC